MNTVYDEKIAIDFKIFPQLETVLRELEADLKILVTVDGKPNRGAPLPEDTPNREATSPEDILPMNWHDDDFINNVCKRLDEFAGTMVNMTQQADEIKTDLRMLRPGSISLVVAET